MKGLIAPNLKGIPEALSDFIWRQAASLKSIFVELKFEARGIELGPVDHRRILSVAISELEEVVEWGKAPSPLPSPAGRGGRRAAEGFLEQRCQLGFVDGGVAGGGAGACGAASVAETDA